MWKKWTINNRDKKEQLNNMTKKWRKSRYWLISCCFTVILNYRGCKECVFHHKINNVWEFSLWSLQHYTCFDCNPVFSHLRPLISFCFGIRLEIYVTEQFFCIWVNTACSILREKKKWRFGVLLTCSGLICSDVGKTSGYEGRSKTRSNASSCCWVKASALRCFRKLSTLPWESLFGPEPSEPSTRRKSNIRDTDPEKLAFTSSYALYILLMYFL